MTQEQFTEWLKERNKAVATLNLKTFKAFYRKWQKRGVYTEPMPDDRVLEMAVCQMALAITPMPLEVRQKAADRLAELRKEAKG